MIKTEKKKKEKRKKNIRAAGLLLAAAALIFLMPVLHTEHIKSSIEIVETPEELLSELLVEWEKNGSKVIGGLYFYPLGRQCFRYSGQGKEIYYIPTANCRYTDIKIGVARWQCTVWVNKVTIKNGRIVGNSRLEGNKIGLKIAVDTGGGADIWLSERTKDGNGIYLQEVYQPHTHRIQQEVSYLLAKAEATREETEVFVLDLYLWRMKEHRREEPYQGNLHIVCSFGEKQIEGAYPFEYSVSGYEG